MRTIKIMLATCLAICMSVLANAESLVVTGKVVDENNQPLVGVSITEKGSSKATITDQKGEYSISTEKGKTLVYNYIGYIKKELKVLMSLMDVKLTPDIVTLNECVTIGYGSVNDGLQGRMAGISTKNIQIRGVSSIQTSYMPTNVYSISENSEEYGKYKENRFISVSNEALSTFSLDVDAASYGNARRLINQGQMPEKDAVRI